MHLWRDVYLQNHVRISSKVKVHETLNLKLSSGLPPSGKIREIFDHLESQGISISFADDPYT